MLSRFLFSILVWRAVMKLLAMALVVSMAMGTILFIAVLLAGGVAHVEVAGAIGAMPLVAVPHIYDTLERVEARKSVTSGHKIMIPTFEGFSVSWPIMVVAGTIVVIVITQFTGAIAGGIADACGARTPSVIGTVGLVSIPFQLAVGYVLGNWIGARSARNGIGAVVFVAALGPTGTKLFDYMVVSADEWRELYGYDKTPAVLIGHILLLFAMWAIPGLLGFWRGRKKRISKYMLYLLSLLPADTRSALSDLAFDEANKVVSGRHAN
jgi:hypothetical protein